MVVTVKYLTFIMRADNHGEGGILALARARPAAHADGAARARIGWAAVLVVIGAALLYGDGTITPAISVLSAMEGLEVATPALKPLVLPLTCAVLVGLFAIQSRGTGSVGALFGPVMLVWFVTIGVLGAVPDRASPVGPRGARSLYAAGFFARARRARRARPRRRRPRRHRRRGALRRHGALRRAAHPPRLARSRHAGARPQLLRPGRAHARQIPPRWTTRSSRWSSRARGRIALVVLSTAATVIASQALIPGAFSLTHQAIQLGYFPRVTVTHTSSEAEGQIYVPEINWALAVACIALVLGFRESSRLAAAYGIAVTGTMVITSVVYFEVTRCDLALAAVEVACRCSLLFLSFDMPVLRREPVQVRRRRVRAGPGRGRCSRW